MGTSNDVRQYALATYIQPARQRGEKTASFSSMELHTGLGLDAQFPQVCSAIDAANFLEFAAVTLVKRDGPKQGSGVHWIFNLNN